MKMTPEQAEKRMFSYNPITGKSYRTSFLEYMLVGVIFDYQKEIIESIFSLEIANARGYTVLHLAAGGNNIEMIKYLINKGSAIDSRTTSGKTALMYAIRCEHYEATKTLLELRTTEVSYGDLLYCLKTLKSWINMEKAVEIMILLRRRVAGLETMPRALMEKLRNPLRYVLLMHHPSFTKLMLETNRYKISERQIFREIKFTMKSEDIGNLQILWLCSTEDLRNYCLYKYLYPKIRRQPSKWRNYLKTVFKRLTEWGRFRLSEISTFLLNIFLKLNATIIEFMLLECNVDVQIKEDAKFDLLPTLFGHPDPTLTKLAFRRGLQINTAKCFKHKTALHYAASRKMRNNVRLLIDQGANLNALDRSYSTPIGLTSCQKCAELLLIHGTDIYVLDRIGKTMFEKLETYNNTWKLLLAQLALDNEHGINIPEHIFYKIYITGRFRKTFEKRLKHIRQILCKNNPFDDFPTMTLFRLVMGNPRRIPHCITNEHDIGKVMKQCREKSIYNYYRTSLKFKLERALIVHQSQIRVAEIISHYPEEFRIDYRHLIMDKIFSFFSYNEMLDYLKIKKSSS